MLFANRNRYPHFEAPTEKSGAGSGDPKPEEKNTEEKPDIEALVKAAVDKETAGLKKTNADLKAEKTDIRQKFDGLAAVIEQIGGQEGAQALLQMKQRFEKDETSKLLAEGKTDEWLAANVANLKGEHDQTVTKLSKDIDAEREGRTRAEQAFANLKLEIAVRDACTTSEGFRKEATGDALLWANSRFTFDHERGIPVKKDENGTVVLGKDGETPMTIAEDLEAAKEDRRHWWEGSQGAGASGGVGGTNYGGKKPEDMSLDEFRKHREKLGMNDGHSAFPG